MTATSKTSLKLSNGILSAQRGAIYPGVSAKKSKSSTLRILSIDGGGIKGIVPATILVYLEQRLRELSGKPDTRLTDYFDWVAGSSTGGILACFYLLPDPKNPSRAKLTAEEALERYLQQGQGAFQRTLLQQTRNKLGIASEQYSHQKLARQLKRTIGADVTLNELIRPCIIPTFVDQEEQPLFFNSQSHSTDRFGNLKAWQVAKATSSAPGFFRPTVLKNKQGQKIECLDGGIWTTDPSLCAYWSARKALCGSNTKQNERKTILVSLGTGKMSRRFLVKELRKQKEEGRMAFNKMLTKQSGSMKQQILEVFDRYESEGAYYRLDPQLTEATSAMDNVATENLKALHEIGLQYIESEKETLEEIAKKLVDSQKVI